MYISYKLLPVRTPTSYKLLSVRRVFQSTSYKLLPDWLHIVTCQVTNMQLILFKPTIQKRINASSMLEVGVRGQE